MDHFSILTHILSSRPLTHIQNKVDKPQYTLHFIYYLLKCIKSETISDEREITQRRDDHMTSKTRGSFLIAGSIIAFIGFLIPALYGVSYDPPAQSAAAQINLSTLAGFNGIVTNATGGVYNGFSGPLDLHITLISIIVTGILGFLAEIINLDEAIAWVQTTFHLLSVSSQLFTVGGIIWQFRSGGAPSEITQKFIADVGGSQSAIDASHYLSGSLGVGFLILFFGFLVGSVGAYSGVGCTLLVLFCLIFAGLLIFTKVTTGAW